MVFQGTVWGPCLGNSFFGDSICVLETTGFTVVVFAGDFNAFKAFKGHISNDFIVSQLDEAQRELHRWGHASQVTFDSGKEHFAILSAVEPHGVSFKMLGVKFDAKLQMGEAVRECVVDASWRMRTLMRTRRMHTTSDLLLLFKSHILSFLEYRTPALYHACTTVLAPLDRVLERFLRDIGVSEVDSLMVFNLAPLRTRRDIAMLGLIHRTVLGEGPPQFSRWFELESTQELRRSARQMRNTVRPLKRLAPGRQLAVFRRSAFGLVGIYNMLPNEVVAHNSVKQFQAALSQLVRREAGRDNPGWRDLFSPRLPYHNHPARRL